MPNTGTPWGSVPSVGAPSFTQYSMPPSSSFTRKPSAAKRTAAFVAPLQPGPQHYTTTTSSFDSAAVLCSLT